MSTNPKDSSGVQDTSASGGGSEGTGRDTVSYETYRKTVSEVKNLKSKLDEFQTKETEREQATLQEQGKFKEALEAANRKLKETELKLDSTSKTFAKQVFSKEAKSVALQMGAAPEGVDDLIRVADWTGVEIGEDFAVNETQLKDAIARMQKQKPLFFKKLVPAPKDVNTGHSLSASGKSVQEMSNDELINAIKSAPQ